ncbi:hypothetical protein A2U01_0114196, partial [Trifolium medium]|nr:hypothetical protein [Trifolium medium]
QPSLVGAFLPDLRRYLSPGWRPGVRSRAEFLPAHAPGVGVTPRRRPG